ncbi:MAG: pilus assembly protein PilM [Candidatus Omnitrophica bacterium]|nr:pilus assembly protein PilM [Candidatus Omnitrophota bacterium]
MNGLGIYIGPKTVSIVESKGKLPVNSAKISRAALSTGDPLEEKVPEEIKIAQAINEELKKNKIEESEVTVVLSGRDLIIRTFEMPLMPKQELDAAVNFEVKKYIPFKVEELVSDFQCRLDKATKKNYVLFVGIKKDTLNKYRSIFSQTGLKVKGIEYSAFSMLRLLGLAGLNEKSVSAIVNVDLLEEDEINFVVLENGFPLFSRDIAVISESQRVVPAATTVPGEEGHLSPMLEKLRREIRISLDYYDRTFPLKNIKKVHFIMNRDYYLELETFIRDIGLGTQWVNITKGVGKPLPFSSAFLKGYSGSLVKVATPVKIDLLLAQEKTAKKPGPKQQNLLTDFVRYKTEMLTLGICGAICAATFLIGAYRVGPAQNELQSILSARAGVTTVSPTVSYDELLAVDAGYKLKTKAIDELVKKPIYLTEVLEVIPRSIPKHLRLLELSFRKSETRIELTLSGTAYLGDSEKEFDLVNSFLAALKEDPAFARYFKDVSISTIDHGQSQGVAVTTFTISCRNYK